MAVHWILCLMVIPLVSSQDVATHCFKDSQPTAKVYLECPAEFTIVVQGVLYGRNSYRECSYTRDTCVMRAANTTGAECLGQTNCTITARRMYSIPCGGYVEFFRVIYECFPVVVARNVTFHTTTTRRPVVPMFGLDSPITNTGDQDKSPGVGVTLAIVGCVLGTAYISVVCIVLAVLFRRNDGKRPLAHDEEQPTELDNSGFRGSDNLREPLPSSTTRTKGSSITGVQRDSTRSNSSGRLGPDGREREQQVPNETTGRRDRNYNNNIQQSSNMTPKNLFPTKDSKQSQQITDNSKNHVNHLSNVEPSKDDSNC